jgi:hypothetical protein
VPLDSQIGDELSLYNRRGHTQATRETLTQFQRRSIVELARVPRRARKPLFSPFRALDLSPAHSFATSPACSFRRDDPHALCDFVFIRRGRHRCSSPRVARRPALPQHPIDSWAAQPCDSCDLGDLSPSGLHFSNGGELVVGHFPTPAFLAAAPFLSASPCYGLTCRDSLGPRISGQRIDRRSTSSPSEAEMNRFPLSRRSR